MLALALIPLVVNRLTACRAKETLARDFAVDLLKSVEPYGVLVTAGDNDTFPLWYAQEVEGVRRDVVIVNLSLANTDWYLRQMQRRPVAEYDAAQGPAIYRGRAWPKPTDRVLAFPTGSSTAWSSTIRSTRRRRSASARCRSRSTPSRSTRSATARATSRRPTSSCWRR